MNELDTLIDSIFENHDAEAVGKLQKICEDQIDWIDRFAESLCLTAMLQKEIERQTNIN